MRFARWRARARNGSGCCSRSRAASGTIRRSSRRWRAVYDRERILTWLQGAQARGELRDDIEAIELGRFATMVLNGLALRVAGEDPFDVESVIALLHDALDPRP
jgi:hypothetical protein